MSDNEFAPESAEGLGQPTTTRLVRKLLSSAEPPVQPESDGILENDIRLASDDVLNQPGATLASDTTVEPEIALPSGGRVESEIALTSEAFTDTTKGAGALQQSSTGVAVSETSEQPLVGGLTEKKVAEVLLASGGDVMLVVERVNRLRPRNTAEITVTDVTEAFIHEVSTNVETQNSIKGLLLLNLLSILTTAKEQLAGAMVDMSGGEIVRTIQMVVEGVAALLPPPAQTPQGQGTTIQILNQLGSDQARSKVAERLETLRKVEDDVIRSNENN